MSFFCPRVSSRVHVTFRCLSPWAPLGWDWVSDGPCLWRPWRFEENWPGFAEWSLSDVFLKVRQGVLGVWKEGHWWKVPFHHIISRAHFNIMHDCWSWPWSPHLSSVCQGSPLPSYSFVLPGFCTFQKKKILFPWLTCTAYVSKWTLCADTTSLEGLNGLAVCSEVRHPNRGEHVQGLCVLRKGHAPPLPRPQ